MDATTRLGLPFPIGGEAADGPVAFEALAEAIEDLLPRAGDLKHSVQAGDHGKWLICDGRTTVLRSIVSTEFVSLMLTLGYAGSDSSHIGLPDYRGRVLAGLGTHADVNQLTDSDGLAVGSRTPKHKSSVNDPGHSHTGRVSDTQAPPDGSTAHTGFLGTAFDGQVINGNGTGISVGPQTARPTDMPAYGVANIFIFAQ